MRRPIPIAPGAALLPELIRQTAQSRVSVLPIGATEGTGNGSGRSEAALARVRAKSPSGCSPTDAVRGDCRARRAHRGLGGGHARTRSTRPARALRLNFDSLTSRGHRTPRGFATASHSVAGLTAPGFPTISSGTRRLGLRDPTPRNRRGGADNLTTRWCWRSSRRIDRRGDHGGGPYQPRHWPIYAFGSEEQKQEWLPRLCAGETLSLRLTYRRPARTPVTRHDGDTRRRRPGGHAPTVITTAHGLSGSSRSPPYRARRRYQHSLFPTAPPATMSWSPTQDAGTPSDTLPLTSRLPVPEGNCRPGGQVQAVPTDARAGFIGVAAVGLALPRARSTRRGLREGDIAFDAPISPTGHSGQARRLSTEIEAPACSPPGRSGEGPGRLHLTARAGKLQTGRLA